MRNETHKTSISYKRAAVDEWRKREGWSRESVCQVIVETFERLGGPETTGIVFDPNTRDLFERQKINAERIFRWLDDVTKDRNLLPDNFSPYLVAALPMDLRLQCLSAIYGPIGISVCSADSAVPADFDATPHLNSHIKEGAEATIALVNVKPGASLAELEAARKEIVDVEESAGWTRRALDAAIASTRDVVAKICARA